MYKHAGMDIIGCRNIKKNWLNIEKKKFRIDITLFTFNSICKTEAIAQDRCDCE